MLNDLDKNKVYEKLIKNQINNIDSKDKLSLLDLKRLADNLLNDIFGSECCFWGGPIITNLNNKSYISFFHNGKKISIHRILYKNYINKLENNEYLKYTCENQGICCCLNHFYKKEKPEKNSEFPDSNTYKPNDSFKKNIYVSF